MTEEKSDRELLEEMVAILRRLEQIVQHVRSNPVLKRWLP